MAVLTRAVELFFVFFFQAEDGIGDLVRSRGRGDVYKRQVRHRQALRCTFCNVRGGPVVVRPFLS